MQGAGNVEMAMRGRRAVETAPEGPPVGRPRNPPLWGGRDLGEGWRQMGNVRCMAGRGLKTCGSSRGWAFCAVAPDRDISSHP